MSGNSPIPMDLDDEEDWGTPKVTEDAEGKEQKKSAELKTRSNPKKRKREQKEDTDGSSQSQSTMANPVSKRRKKNPKHSPKYVICSHDQNT